jgi:hypothetical protein
LSIPAAALLDANGAVQSTATESRRRRLPGHPRAAHNGNRARQFKDGRDVVLETAVQALNSASTMRIEDLACSHGQTVTSFHSVRGSSIALRESKNFRRTEMEE